MFKDAMQYSDEELLRSCQAFFGGLYWAWYSAAVQAVGEEKTAEIMKVMCGRFAELEEVYMKQLWGGEFRSLQDLAKPLDVVHRMLTYEGRTRGSVPDWTWSDENKGYERIGYCPIHAATPEEFKDKGPTPLCTVYCHSIGQQFYGRMGCSIRQDSWLSKGGTHCGYHIEKRADAKPAAGPG